MVHPHGYFLSSVQLLHGNVRCRRALPPGLQETQPIAQVNLHCDASAFGIGFSAHKLKGACLRF